MTPPPGNQASPWWMQVLPLVFIVGIFYFLLFRPARTRQKEVSQMLDGLKPGDKVITSGGLLGTVVAGWRHNVLVRVALDGEVDDAQRSLGGVRGARGAPP